jgi:hypothetical protein
MHPNFICIGAQKAGTDWVYDQFATHRDYWMPPIKEIAFFDQGYGGPRMVKADRQLEWKTQEHAKGKSDYTYDLAFLLRMKHREARPWSHDFAPYFALFDNKPGFSGDCTPGYCRLKEDMVREMMRQMPQTRFLLMVRDPAERLWSQALMHERLDRNPDLQQVDELADFKAFSKRKEVRELSFLSKTIKTWQAVDTEGRFKVFQFDDLKVDAEGYRTSVAEHVGADPRGFAIPADFNKKAKQKGKKTIPPAFRAYLARFFEDEFKELETLIGGHAVTWRARNDEILKHGVKALSDGVA